MNFDLPLFSKLSYKRSENEMRKGRPPPKVVVEENI